MISQNNKYKPNVDIRSELSRDSRVVYLSDCIRDGRVTLLTFKVEWEKAKDRQTN